jgi:hypothetical protein
MRAMTLPLHNPRYERKFVIEHSGAHEVLALVRRHPAAFHEAYPPRIVNNVYLDSPGLASYCDHVDGAMSRTKTRVRWYGSPGSQIPTASLERKFKRGLVSGKITEPLPAFCMNGAGVRAELEKAFAGALLPELLKLDLARLGPSLFNRYHRRYFISADGRFRLTIDSDLQFGMQRRESAVSGLRSLPLVVIELKFGTEQLDGASSITNALPFRMVRCSKYVLGIDLISRN